MVARCRHLPFCPCHLGVENPIAPVTNTFFVGTLTRGTIVTMYFDGNQ